MFDIPKLLRHVIVGLDGGSDVALVDADGNAHKHVLWSFGDLAVDFKQVRTLEGLHSHYGCSQYCKNKAGRNDASAFYEVGPPRPSRRQPQDAALQSHGSRRHGKWSRRGEGLQEKDDTLKPK